MKAKIFGIAAALLVSSVGVADNHPTGDAAIEARQTAMKAVGAAAKAGDFPALNEAALASQIAFQADTTADGTLKTKASPAIWEDAAGFNAIMTQLIELSTAGDRAAFGTCKACHSDYRE
ncbi:MAG: hypothetical protein AAF429_00040 [Pseudomonadota bacterium]